MIARLATLAALVLLAGTAAACAGAAAESPPHPTITPDRAGRIAVPRVVGLTRSRAACRLVAVALRWRGGGEHAVHRRAFVPCHDRRVHVAPDPIVRRQRPRAGRRVAPGTVVVIEDDCTLLRFRKQPTACS
jgi:hypothetical protein